MRGIKRKKKSETAGKTLCIALLFDGADSHDSGAFRRVVDVFADSHIVYESWNSVAFACTFEGRGGEKR